jgi:hypothetical protein
MNGRTTDRTKPNVFWVVDSDAVGNFGNPKIKILDFFGGGVERNNQYELSTESAYGSQMQGTTGGGTYNITMTLRDMNNQEIATLPLGPHGTAYIRCSDSPVISLSGPILKSDGSPRLVLDDVRTIEFKSNKSAGDVWKGC